MAGVIRHLLLSMLLVVLVTVATPAILADQSSNGNGSGRTDSFAPTDNSVLEFSAAGAKGNDLLQVSSSGGTVKLSGREYRVWPWHHVKAEFELGPVWIIFLANVEPDNFRVMYLYLNNRTTVFGLRIFNYQTGSLETRSFEGDQWVSERAVPAPRPSPAPVSLVPEAKTGADVSLLGSQIYINGKAGLAYEGNEELVIYPIYNQGSAEAGKWNELWALIKTRSNDLYYSIFYTQNGDETTVYRGHTLRLSDFSYMNWYTYKARWTKGQFQGEVRFRTPFENLTVAVDGFPFKTTRDGSLKVQVPFGPLQIDIQRDLYAATGVRQTFARWNDGNQDNSRNLFVDGSHFLTATYKRQYLLQTFSVPQPYDPTGWYDENTSVEIQLPSVVDYGNGSRQVFRGWTGDIQSVDPTLSVVLDSPKTIQASWRLEYLLTIELLGLPDGTVVKLRINGSLREVSASRSHNEWIEAESTVTVLPDQNQTVINGEGYSLDSWVTSSSSEPLSMPFTLSKPITIRGTFRLTSTYESNLDIRTSGSTVPYGGAVEITGRLNPAVQDTEVFLFASEDNSTWLQLAQTKTNSDGSFTFRWTPAEKGTFYLQVRWSGNNNLRGSSSPVRTLNVIEYNEPINQPLGSLQQRLQQAIGANAQANAAYTIITAPAIAIFDIAEKAAPSLAANPIVSQILYFTIAGSFLGLVYILPIGVLSSSIRALRRKRAAGPKGTITVFLILLAVLATSFAAAFGVLTVGTTLLALLLLLIMTTSALMLPMIISLAITHIIAP